MYSKNTVKIRQYTVNIASMCFDVRANDTHQSLPNSQYPNTLEIQSNSDAKYFIVR